MPPKISICVPNLNTRPYLPERFESIFNQSFQDWEVIVYDSYSDDGSWEYIQELAAHEPRMRISQGPREGVYPGWNACIRQARGEYVYIATSDDTMTPDCLEKLVVVLEAHPECSLSHCCATFIDERSQPIDWKWETWPSVKYFGELIKIEHSRPPGHDSVLAFALATPYYSIAQLLIRRKLFEMAGYFESRWGSFGDLEWQMRAALLTPTIHITEHLATWRKHPNQASQSDRYYSARRNGWFVQMADEVIEFSRRKKVPGPKGLPRRLRRFFVIEQMNEAWKHSPGFSRKLYYLGKSLIVQPRETFWFLDSYFRSKRGQPRLLEQEVRHELASLRIGNPISTGT